MEIENVIIQYKRSNKQSLFLRRSILNKGSEITGKHEWTWADLVRKELAAFLSSLATFYGCQKLLGTWDQASGSFTH